MSRWRLTAEELAALVNKTLPATVARGKRLTGQAAEDAFSAEMDPKATLVYDNIDVVDHTGCAIPRAAGDYPKPQRTCPYCKQKWPE